MTLTGDDDGEGDEVEDSFHAAVLFVSSIGAAVLDRRDGKKESKAANEIQTKRDKRRTRVILVDDAWTASEISRYISYFVFRSLGLRKPCESYPLGLRLRSSVYGRPSSKDHKLLESDCLDA